jgi:hypothetical protein
MVLKVGATAAVDILRAADSADLSALLTVLDKSAGFDTVDRVRLLVVLRCLIDSTAMCSVLTSYLSMVVGSTFEADNAYYCRVVWGPTSKYRS